MTVGIPSGVRRRVDVYHFGAVVGVIAIDLRCPHCGRYLSSPRRERGLVRLRMAAGGEVVDEIRGYQCSRCGEVEPAFEWVDPDDLEEIPK